MKMAPPGSQRRWSSSNGAFCSAHFHPPQWRSGGGGGAWPPGASLGGAPAQLIGANFKKKIRPRQIIKVTSLKCRINLAAKVFFFFACQTEGGGTPSPKGASRVGLCGRGVLMLMGGGGGDASIGPRALETLATPLIH